MLNNKKEFVYIIGDNTQQEKIKLLQTFFNKFGLAVFIDYEGTLKHKKELLKTNDVIFLLTDELLLKNEFQDLLSIVLLHHKNYFAFNTEPLFVDDLNNYFSINQNFKFTEFNQSVNFLYHLLFSLIAFKSIYKQKYQNLEKQYANDKKLILFLKYLIYYNIYKQEDILKVLKITKNEYLKYYNILKQLLVINEEKDEIVILNEDLISQYLPNMYKEIFKKNHDEIDIYKIFNNIFLNYQKINEFLNNFSISKIDNQFQQIYDAYRNHLFIKNELINIFELIEVVRILDDEIIFNIPFKDILKIKNYLRDNTNISKSCLQKNKQINIYINYVKDESIHINYFLSWHQRRGFNLVDDINQADIVVSLITSKSIYDEHFLNNIRYSININLKTLYIYIDRIELNLKMQYLIKFYHDMCYWAYKRIDTFYEKYLEQLQIVLEGENQLPHTAYYTNITKLK